jgi:hypothetical protein
MGYIRFPSKDLDSTSYIARSRIRTDIAYIVTSLQGNDILVVIICIVAGFLPHPFRSTYPSPLTTFT